MDEEEKYLFAYSIRLSLKPEGCVVDGVSYDSCQLYWRKWLIKSNDTVVGHVSSEAVIGLVNSFNFFYTNLVVIVHHQYFAGKCIIVAYNLLEQGALLLAHHIKNAIVVLM